MLDAILAICLLGLVPAYMLWRSRRPGNARPTKPAVVSMLRTLLLASGLLTLLAASWVLNARPVSVLGLTAPLSPPAEIGLGLAIVLLGGFAIAIVVQLSSKKTKVEDIAKALERLPQTKGEAARYIPMVIVVCAAWEVLYRGFLLWFLTPHTGLPGAVILSATAYALAHGYTGVRRFAASLVSALLFTVAYAITQNLWWLILLHMGFPILGTLASLYRPRSGAPPLVRGADSALPTS